MSPRDVEGDDHVDQMATDSPLICLDRWDYACEEVGSVWHLLSVWIGETGCVKSNSWSCFRRSHAKGSEKIDSHTKAFVIGAL